MILYYSYRIIKILIVYIYMASLTTRYAQRSAFQILEVCLYEIRWLKTCLYILIADRAKFSMIFAACTIREKSYFTQQFRLLSFNLYVCWYWFSSISWLKSWKYSFEKWKRVSCSSYSFFSELCYRYSVIDVYTNLTDDN